MASEPPVKTGFWTNFETDHKSYLWTIPEIWATILKVLLGVAFGMAWPWAKVILQHTWFWLSWRWPRLKKSWKRHRSGSGPQNEDTPLLPPHPDSEDTRSRPYRLTDWMKIEKSDLFLALITAALSFLYAVAGGAVGEIPANTLARIDTPGSDCGPWDLKKNADRRVRDFDNLLLAKKESRAAGYGRDCYASHSIYTPGRCDFFETSQIEYEVKRVHCPFPCSENRCICANGRFETAIQLSTGYFSAARLGLNGENLPFIKRTSTFVPLDINHGFVSKSGSRGEGNVKFEYYLGSINTAEGSRNYTFDMYGDPFDWDIAAYSVSVYESTPSPDFDAWQPIEELQVGRPMDSYMTAIFISPCRIVYNGRCEDPLFLATDDLGDFGLPNKYYREDPRARVLIAIDQMEVCREKDVDCFPPYESNLDFGIEYEFVRTALRRTSSFQSIQNQLGESLVAAESISDFDSRQLDREQWVIESKALFNTSLARLQFNILDMATGNHPTGAAAGGFESAYENSTPPWARRKMKLMCDNYKFNMSGPYTNISIWTLLILLVPVVLFVLGRNMNKPQETDEVPPIEGDWMVFDRMIWLGVQGVRFMKSWPSKPPSDAEEAQSQDTGAQEAPPPQNAQQPGDTRHPQEDQQPREAQRVREDRQHDEGRHQHREAQQ